MMNLVIYLPAFNEEKMIGRTIESLPTEIEGIKSIRIVVVDDGSNDNTVKIAKSKGAYVVSHNTNRGVGSAFQTAVETSLELKTDIMLSIDADGQFSPSDIPSILSPIIKKRADFVTGNRFHTKGVKPEHMSKVKFWGNKQIARLVSKVASKKIHDVACGFRAYNREALLSLNLMGKFTYTQETILDLTYKGFRLCEVPISVKYFKDRTSRVANSIVKYAFNTFFIIFRCYRDYKPLSFFGTVGGAIFLVGLLLDLVLLIHYLIYNSFTPYKIFGFAGSFLNMMGLLTLLVGVVTDMLDRQRVTQEKILYYLKKSEYYNEPKSD